ncbi:MAG: rRNA ((1939)-C(5))-methyltransferase RlmD [Bacteroidota bacterium]|jgi:23S rRNA (uracil1939-C5)-methyltransferase
MLGQLVKNVKIEGVDARGIAFGRFSGGLVLVDKAVPGDIANVQALRLTKGQDAIYTGRIIELIEPSSSRIAPFCKHFQHCGGCQWQTLTYSDQLRLKQQQVATLFDRHLPVDSSTPLPIASPLERHYRNKIVFNFSNRRWMTPEEKADPATIFRPAAGYMMQGKYDHAIEIHACDIAPQSAIEIMHTVRDTALENHIPFYDMRKEQGVLRQLMVRYGDNGSILVRFVFGKFDPKALELFIQTIAKKYPAVLSVSYLINPDKDGKVNELETKIAWGSPTIPITLNGLHFEMSPGSFFQTNTLQTEQLYATAIDWCSLTGKETVYDFYSGTGTIALSAARRAKHVVGIEFVNDAVEGARKNAHRNHIKNATFIAGDLKDVIASNAIKVNGQPDVVITDPPRSGHHRDVNNALLQILPDRIVYISCNPRTQERDVRILSSHYRLEKIQPFDMFPHTGHVENVALLVRR